MRDKNQDLLYRRCHAFELKVRAELLAEAKRPVESLSDEYVERLVGRMEAANRFSWPTNYTVNV